MTSRKKLPVPQQYIAAHSTVGEQMVQPIDTLYNYCTQQWDTGTPIQLLSDGQALRYIPLRPETAHLYWFYREHEEMLPLFAAVNVLLDMATGPLEGQHWLICDRCGAVAGLDELLREHTCQEESYGTDDATA